MVDKDKGVHISFLDIFESRLLIALFDSEKLCTLESYIKFRIWFRVTEHSLNTNSNNNDSEHFSSLVHKWFILIDGIAKSVKRRWPEKRD